AHVHFTAQNQRSTICVAPDLYLESGSLHLCPRTQTCRMTSTCLQCRSLTLRQIGTRPRVAAHDVVVDVKEHSRLGPPRARSAWRSNSGVGVDGGLHASNGVAFASPIARATAPAPVPLVSASSSSAAAGQSRPRLAQSRWRATIRTMTLADTP